MSACLPFAGGGARLFDFSSHTYVNDRTDMAIAIATDLPLPATRLLLLFDPSFLFLAFSSSRSAAGGEKYEQQVGPAQLPNDMACQLG